MEQVPRITIFEATGPEADFFRSRLEGEPIITPEPLTGETAELASGCSVVSVFVYSDVNKDVLAALPDLRLIATRSTGFDHIDLGECKARGIVVCNIPEYGDNTVAEHTFALILALSRKVIQGSLRARTGDFNLEGLQGFDLRGKTLGVVGTGSIGTHVIRIAKGFLMDVIAFDVNKDKRLSDGLGFTYVDNLDELLERSDIVSLHVPYNEHTHHLINGETLQRFKRGAILINTSRGAVVETEALVHALDSGILGGVGIDVLEGETLIKEEKQLLSHHFDEEQFKTVVRNHILLREENAVITPHIAFHSVEAAMRIMDTTLANIRSFLEGKPINRVA